MLHVHMGETSVRVVFEIVKNLTVTILLGTKFIDKFVVEIFPAEKKIVLYNSQLVRILIVPVASKDNETTTKTGDVTDGSVLTVETEDEKRVLRVARATTLQPMS